MNKWNVDQYLFPRTFVYASPSLTLIYLYINNYNRYILPSLIFLSYIATSPMLFMFSNSYRVFVNPWSSFHPVRCGDSLLIHGWYQSLITQSHSIFAKLETENSGKERGAFWYLSKTSRFFPIPYSLFQTTSSSSYSPCRTPQVSPPHPSVSMFNIHNSSSKGSELAITSHLLYSSSHYGWYYQRSKDLSSRFPFTRLPRRTGSLMLKH